MAHLRGTAGEFAKAFPNVARRLALEEFDCADPYVERLLEGFAFLSARVQLKLDAEFPRFTQFLLETIYPNYLAPVPSMAIVQFQPDLSEGGLVEGFRIPRQAPLRSILDKTEHMPCVYRTAHDVTMYPIQIVEARYYTRDLGSLGLRVDVPAKAALRLRLEAPPGLTFSAIKLDQLVLHLKGSADVRARLYQQMIGASTEVVVQPVTRPVLWSCAAPASGIRRVGFGRDEGLLPSDARLFYGYRLLQEYFAFPERFMFVSINNLSRGVRQCKDRRLDVILLLREADVELENAVDAGNFALFCTPVVNLFPKTCDRVSVSDRFSEHHVVPDRTRPLDFEVFSLQRVTGYGSDLREQREFLPFYRATDVAGEGGAYYAMHRVPRMPSADRHPGRRSQSYGGSEVYLSLVDAKAAPYRSDLRELSVEALCTNRDLPLMMPVGQGRTDFSMDGGSAVESIRCVGTPTRPVASHVEGEFAWRAISHLSLNYLSLADTEKGTGAAALQDLLKLYSNEADPQIARQIKGIKSVQSATIVRRVRTPGPIESLRPIAFARGLEVAVTLDESLLDGAVAFLFGAVLEHFFSEYVSLNSFTETVIRTPSVEVMRWPARLGQRQIV
jgi:type VI secretion system protein ImpG